MIPNEIVQRPVLLQGPRHKGVVLDTLIQLSPMVESIAWSQRNSHLTPFAKMRGEHLQFYQIGLRALTWQCKIVRTLQSNIFVAVEGILSISRTQIGKSNMTWDLVHEITVSNHTVLIMVSPLIKYIQQKIFH